jgi:hypothetical protein
MAAGATITLNVDQLPDDLTGQQVRQLRAHFGQTQTQFAKTMGCRDTNDWTLGTGRVRGARHRPTIVEGAVGFAASDGSRIFRLICSYGVG